VRCRDGVAANEGGEFPAIVAWHEPDAGDHDLLPQQAARLLAQDSRLRLGHAPLPQGPVRQPGVADQRWAFSNVILVEIVLFRNMSVI